MRRVLKNIVLLMFGIVVMSLLGACAKPTLSTIPIECEDDTKPCAFFAKEGNDFWGAGRTTIAGIAGGKFALTNEETGEVTIVDGPIQPLTSGTYLDRGDTLFNTLLGKGLDFAGTVYSTEGNKYVGKKMSKTKDDSNPGTMIYNDVKGGNANAFSDQMSTIKNGVEIIHDLNGFNPTLEE